MTLHDIGTLQADQTVQLQYCKLLETALSVTGVKRMNHPTWEYAVVYFGYLLLLCSLFLVLYILPILVLARPQT